jgi:hypothetical protein
MKRGEARGSVNGNEAKTKLPQQDEDILIDAEDIFHYRVVHPKAAALVSDKYFVSFSRMRLTL